MNVKWVIDGAAQVGANGIDYTGTVLDKLQRLTMRSANDLGHAGIGSGAIRIEIDRLSRGLAADIVPFQKYFGANQLIDSVPFPSELVLIDENLPGPDAFVGRFTIEHMRIVFARTLDSDGGPLHRFVVHASGVNQNGRDGATMLVEPIVIPGFDQV